MKVGVEAEDEGQDEGEGRGQPGVRGEDSPDEPGHLVRVGAGLRERSIRSLRSLRRSLRLRLVTG